MPKPFKGAINLDIEFIGGRVVKVVFDVADDAYIDASASSRRR